MSEWKRIDSAPKDGTPILGWADGTYATVKWKGEYWGLTVCGAYADDSEWTPEYWWPLPAPPPSEPPS